MKEKNNKIVKRLNDLYRHPDVKEYLVLQKELIMRQCCSTEEEYINMKNHLLEISKLDKDGKMMRKFIPDMFIECERIDSETPNPIDMSNAPDDADHNPNFHNEKVVNTIHLTINKKKEAR